MARKEQQTELRRLTRRVNYLKRKQENPNLSNWEQENLWAETNVAIRDLNEAQQEHDLK